ncbi:MAG: HIT domain-containing protein [Ignavibacteriae bacterium]|nr:HIT domain-containing protein [Ignavibacteriota bacterium]
MDRLWSPWRSQYIQAIGTDKEPQGCVFCDAIAADDDDARYLVRRHGDCVTLLNLYPYNSGHLLIVPHRHTDSYLELDAGSHMEMWDLVRVWIRVLTDVMRPQGFNIGSNVGRVAGAGIDQHIHLHIVPRWSGDMNFMPVIGDTKVISESMHDTMLRLRDSFDRLAAGAPGA